MIPKCEPLSNCSVFPSWKNWLGLDFFSSLTCYRAPSLLRPEPTPVQYYAMSLSPPPPAALGRPRWAFLVSGSRGRCDARFAGALYTVNERPDCGVRRVPQPSKVFPFFQLPPSSPRLGVKLKGVTVMHPGSLLAQAPDISKVSLLPQPRTPTSPHPGSLASSHRGRGNFQRSFQG